MLGGRVTLRFLRRTGASCWLSEVPDVFTLPQLAEVVSGLVLNKQGVLEPTTLNCPEVLSQLRHDLAGNDDWAVWGRWFLADPQTRAISPFSEQTIAQYVENRINDGTEEALDEAERIAADNKQWLKRIVEARANLRQYSHAPVPNAH